MKNKATCGCKFGGFRARRQHLAAAVMDFQADPLSSGSQEEGQSITFPLREVEEGGALASAVYLLARCPPPSHLVPPRFSSFVTVQLQNDQIVPPLISLLPSESCVFLAILSHLCCPAVEFHDL